LQPCKTSKNQYNSIVGYQPIGVHEIYDFWVPECGNYIAAGVVHHNTRCGSREIAMHLTGLYPDWWKGQRFSRPVDCLIASNTNETTRDICQDALFGDPADDSALGTGAVPLHCIGERTSKPGVPNAYDVVLVKHVTGGWSKAQFKAYEQGFKKFMGRPRDVNWLDEEPPQDIWAQVVRGTFARKDTVTLITMTPEEGMTDVVRQFLEDLQKGQAVIRATWDDAPHMTPEMRANKLLSIPAHQRDMRSKGDPLMGAGIVFPFAEDQITVEPFEIPRHWPQIIGIDFGWQHPFAACNLAYDRDTDTIYITADYREPKVTPAIHAAAIRPWGAWKPVAWPHDGLNTEKGTGDELRQAYVNEGFNVLPWKATNPPQAGKKEGEGGNSVEAALLDMFERFESGRLKVFKTCRNWLEEHRSYHRDVKGKIVPLFDDTISASRYGIMMIRHARTQVIKRQQQNFAVGATNW
jgi:phage terminase large subunit-like protein